MKYRAHCIRIHSPETARTLVRPHGGERTCVFHAVFSPWNNRSVKGLRSLLHHQSCDNMAQPERRQYVRHHSSSIFFRPPSWLTSIVPMRSKKAEFSCLYKNCGCKNQHIIPILNHSGATIMIEKSDLASTPNDWWSTLYRPGQQFGHQSGLMASRPWGRYESVHQASIHRPAACYFADV